MKMGGRFTTTISVMTWLAATTAVQAQAVDFACPKAGTLEQRANSTIKYTGTAPSDPYICMRISAYGKTEQRLFNLYGLSNHVNTAAANAEARTGMMDLLSGRKTSVTVSYTPNNGYTITDTWKLLRREPLTVGGQTFNTVVLDRDLLGNASGRSGFHGHYVMWLDPKTGIWLKSDFNVIAGQVNKYPAGYADVSVTLP